MLLAFNTSISTSLLNSIKRLSIIFHTSTVIYDLLDFINQYYESGEPEVESEFEYDGTEFEEPDVLPDNNECNGEENDDDHSIRNRNNGNFCDK